MLRVALEPLKPCVATSLHDDLNPAHGGGYFDPQLDAAQLQQHPVGVILQLHTCRAASQRAASTDGAVAAGKVGWAPDVQRFADQLISRPADRCAKAHTRNTERIVVASE